MYKLFTYIIKIMGFNKRNFKKMTHIPVPSLTSPFLILSLCFLVFILCLRMLCVCCVYLDEVAAQYIFASFLLVAFL